MSITSRFVSYVMHRGDVKKNEGLTTPADIERFDDLKYGKSFDMNGLDVYRPLKAKGRKLPVIISVHGGGWVYGDKELYQYYCMSLAQQGFAVINFSYPLAPQAKFPSIVESTRDVFAWVLDQAHVYDLDTNNLFAVGDSAGAHTLAQFCALLTHPEYAKRFDFDLDVRMLPKAIALNCGIYDCTSITKLSFLMNRLLKDYLPKDNYATALQSMNLLPYITSTFPPSFIMTSNGDFLQDQAPRLESRLKEKGVQVQSKYYGTAEKVLTHVFHCDLRLDEAKQCNQEETEFFKEFCV
jgi:acetyl esterase/lipase